MKHYKTMKLPKRSQTQMEERPRPSFFRAFFRNLGEDFDLPSGELGLSSNAPICAPIFKCFYYFLNIFYSVIVILKHFYCFYSFSLSFLYVLMFFLVFLCLCQIGVFYNKIKTLKNFKNKRKN